MPTGGCVRAGAAGQVAGGRCSDGSMNSSSGAGPTRTCGSGRYMQMSRCAERLGPQHVGGRRRDPRRSGRRPAAPTRSRSDRRCPAASPAAAAGGVRRPRPGRPPPSHRPGTAALVAACHRAVPGRLRAASVPCRLRHDPVALQPHLQQRRAATACSRATVSARRSGSATAFQRTRRRNSPRSRAAGADSASRTRSRTLPSRWVMRRHREVALGAVDDLAGAAPGGRPP